MKKTNVSGGSLKLTTLRYANFFKIKNRTIGNFNYLESNSKIKKPKNFIKLIKKELEREGFNVRL